MSIAWLKNRDDSAAPGRLWSLWDIMKPFDAALFMRFMEAAGMTRTLEALVGEVSVSDGWVRDWLILMDLYEQPCVELNYALLLLQLENYEPSLPNPTL